MIDFKLNEQEAFLIFSLRKGYARHESVIYGLAGMPWTKEELERYLSCSNEYEHKKMEIDYYINNCRRRGEPINIVKLNEITTKYDKEIQERQQQTQKQYKELLNRYNEFLSFYKVRKI